MQSLGVACLAALLVPVACGGSTPKSVVTKDAGADRTAADRTGDRSAPSQSCPSPRDARLVYASGAVCSGDGVFSGAAPDGCCTTDQSAVGDVTVSLDGPGYEGALEPCSDVDPITGVDIQLKIERVQSVADAGGVYRTVIDAARLDVSPSCGHRLVVTSYFETCAAVVGATWRVRQHTVPYDSPTGDIVKTTLVVTGVGGQIVLVSALGVTPSDIDNTLLPAFGLAVDDAPVCRWGSADAGSSALLRVHVTNGGADCVLSSGTERCCTLGGSMLEALVQSATRTPTESPSVLVNLTLRQPGLFVRAP